MIPRYVKKDIILLQLYMLATETEKETINWDNIIDKGIPMKYPVKGIDGCFMYKIPWNEGGYTLVFIDPYTGTTVATLNDDQLSQDINW